MPLSNKYLEEVSFQNPLGKTPVMEGIYNTGEYVLEYGDQQTVMAFVSADASRAELKHFGAYLPFQKTVMTNEKDCPIEVGSIVHYGGEDWIVKKIIKAKCLSYMAWGMDRVDIGGDDT